MSDVTVLMTVYNGLPYLKESMDSILNQTWSDFEFLIIDDASTDASREWVRSYGDPRIRLIENSWNMNQTRSLNRGLEYVRGNLVVRMDSDDVSATDRIERQVRFLRSHPDVAVVGSDIRWLDSRGMVTGTLTRARTNAGIAWNQLFSCDLAGGGVTYRREVIRDRLGGYSEDFTFAQDWELWSRLHHQGYRAANLDGFLIDVRMHPDSNTVKYRERIRGEVDRIRRLYRQRMFSALPDGERVMARLDECIALRHRNPEYRLGIYETLYSAFGRVMPESLENAEVCRALHGQLLDVLAHCGPGHLPAVRKTLRLMAEAGGPDTGKNLWAGVLRGLVCAFP